MEMERLHPDDPQLPFTASEPLSQQSTSNSHLDVRLEDIHHIEYNISSHKYLINRPRALQYTYQSRLVNHEDGTRSPVPHGGATLPGHQSTGNDGALARLQSHQPDEREVVVKHRERLDLFIDLIWVGIITNLSEVFASYFFSAEDQVGTAVLVFITAFLPTWRIWNVLREFLNNYYMDDIIQRVFVFWVLLLSVYYGNNLAYLPEDTDRAKVVVITLFLIIRVSFVFMEGVYSIFIPWLRYEIAVSFLLILPSAMLWIGAIFVDGNRALGPIWAALLWEYSLPWVQQSRLFDRIIPSGYRKAADSAHLKSRMQNFLIITVGEGILSLIRDGPLGLGIQASAGTCIFSLLNYFVLVLLYFNRDYSRTYLSAVRHRGWRTMIWVSCHIPVFASFLIMAAATTFILRNESEIPHEASSEESETQSPEELEGFIRNAIWTIAASLSIILSAFTAIALLDKSLDPPGTLMVNNRYLRLAVRPAYVATVLGLASAHSIGHDLFLTLADLLLVALSVFEYVVSLEKGGGIIEPKGISGLLKSEIVPGRLGMA